MTKVVLVLFLAVVPIVAYGFAIMVQRDYDSQWNAYLLKQYQGDLEKVKQQPDFAEFCVTSGSLAVQCGIYNTAVFLKRSALATAGLGLLLFVLVGAAGYVSRSSRKLLLILFRPGLYLTVLASIVLVVLHAALAMGVVYLLNVYTGFFFFIFVIMGIGIGAILGCIAIIRGTISVFRPSIVKVLGVKLSADKQPDLHQLVNNLSRNTGALPPHHIVAGLDPNFFVTQTRVECHDRRLSGRTLYLSLPLCRILSHEELRAVIGHELGHFKGLDTEFSGKFYPIYRAAAECLSRLERELQGRRAIALFPAYYFLLYFLESLSLAETKISRERELEADRIGAHFVGATSFGTALIKVHAFQDFWEWFRQAARDAIAMNKPFTNASSMFAEGVRDNWQRSAFDGLEELETPHPTNSHPTLKVRLEALNLKVSGLVERGMVALPNSPAIELITNYAQIEEELTAIKHKSVVKSREVPSAKKCPMCTRVVPFTTELCECGFNFVRLPMG
jgi:Zn-dependent protease with chaperone function